MKLREVTKSGGAFFTPTTDDARTPINLRVGYWKPSKKQTKRNKKK